MKVLSFGSLNIDYVYKVPHFVAGGETLASESMQIFSGGKGLNQSIALARAGLEVFHAGAIGPDGSFLLDELRSAGVDVTGVELKEEIRTGHAIIQNDNAGDNCILLFGGANREITRNQIDRTLSQFTQGDALVIQNEISELAYLVKKARDTGMYIVMNPSPMEDYLTDLVPQVDLLILNEIEASQIIGGDMSPEELGKSLHDLYPSLTVVLTIGEHGSIFISGETVIRESAVKVEAVDTTAAGDTFTGYFLAGYLTKNDPAWAMKLAAAAAAIAVTRPGASPSIPEKSEVITGA